MEGSNSRALQLLAEREAGGQLDPLRLDTHLEEDDTTFIADFDELKKELSDNYIVIARFNTSGVFSAYSLFLRMKTIWQLRGGMMYKALADKKFLIEFHHEGHYRHVLAGGPWTHHGDALLLEAYDGRSSASDITLRYMPVWVRIMDLPLSMMNE